MSDLLLVDSSRTGTGPRYPPTTPSFETISNPQSQTSSFNESMSSQPLESLDKNTVSQHSSLLRTASPATSVSARASQENTLSPVRESGTVRKGQDLHDVTITHGGQGTRLSSQPSTARNRPTSAPKRMLNGEVKSAANSQVTSPVDERSVSRRSSRESQAAEVCLPISSRDQADRVAVEGPTCVCEIQAGPRVSGSKTCRC